MNSLNRELSFTENMFEMFHELGATLVVYAARIEGEISPNIVKQALDLIQQRHPMLQVHIVRSGDNLYFQSQGTQAIPLRLIAKQYENQWIEIVEDELHEKFPPGQNPLCQVTLLQSSKPNNISEIIIKFHHAISDGISSMHLLDDLLTYYNQLKSGECMAAIFTMQPLPPVESLLSYSFNNQEKIEKSPEQFSQKTQKPKLMIECEALPSACRTRFITRNLSQEITLALKNRCKQEKTTVHGALCAAMMFASVKIFSTETPVYISCNSSVNLRKYCQPEVKNDYMSCLISFVENFYSLETEITFWDLARESKANISHFLDNKEFLMSFKSKYFHENNGDDNSFSFDKQSFINRLKQESQREYTSLFISNIGQFTFPEHYGGLKLKELYFSTGQHIFGSYLGLATVTFHEQMFFSFGYVEPLLSAKTVELFASTVTSLIYQACLSQSLTLNLIDKAGVKPTV